MCVFDQNCGDAFAAACLGVNAHATAADTIAKRRDRGLLATDLAAGIPGYTGTAGSGGALLPGQQQSTDWAQAALLQEQEQRVAWARNGVCARSGCHSPSVGVQSAASVPRSQNSSDAESGKLPLK